MSDENEPLARATRALRAQSTGAASGRGASAGGPLARAQVVARVRRRRVRARRVSAAGAALAVTVLAAGAWAAATGRLPLLVRWHGVAPVSAPASSRDAVPRRHALARGAQPETARVEPPVPETARPEPLPLAPPEPTRAVVAPPSVAPAPDITSESASHARTQGPNARVAVNASARAHGAPSASRVASASAPGTSESATSAPRALEPSPAPVAPEPAPTPAPADPAYALFREANDAHHARRDPREVLALWDRYLREAPAGQLAPEARYNRALTLVRLRRYAEARAALAPFAANAYHGYRTSEAAALLARLPTSAP